MKNAIRVVFNFFLSMNEISNIGTKKYVKNDVRLSDDFDV